MICIGSLNRGTGGDLMNSVGAASTETKSHLIFSKPPFKRPKAEKGKKKKEPAGKSEK